MFPEFAHGMVFIKYRCVCVSVCACTCAYILESGSYLLPQGIVCIRNRS